jgi:hypothetical protein
LLQTLDSIRTHIYKIVILDNNSTDGTNTIKSNTFGYSIDLISSKLNVGLRNNLIKSYTKILDYDNLEYDYVWILSDDDYLDEFLLDKIVENLIKKKASLYFVNHSVKSSGEILKKSALSELPSKYFNLREIFRIDGPQFMLLGSMIYKREILGNNSINLQRIINNSEITLPFRFAMYFAGYNINIINYPESFINDQTEISWKDESYLVYRKYLLNDLFKLFLVKRDFKYLVDIFKYIFNKVKSRFSNV